jgi:predicted Zn-dependent protease
VIRIGGRARELLILLAVLAALALAALGAQQVFFPRRAPAPDLPAKIDEALGPVLASEVRLSQRVIDDPRVTEGFAAMFERLVPAMSGAGAKPQLLVVDAPEINAYTLPGGVVVVDSGLARALDSAAEMAAVIAHELGHVANRDPLSLLARQLGMATIAAAVTGGQGSALFSTMVQTMVNVRYGREAEDRADAFAVDLLGRASIEPSAFADALARIKEAGPKYPDLLKYIDPHSPIDERIDAAEAQARQWDGRPRKLGVDWRLLLEALPGEPIPDQPIPDELVPDEPVRESPDLRV